MSLLWGYDNQQQQDTNRAARDQFEAKARAAGLEVNQAWSDAKSKATAWYQANDPGLLDRFSGKNNKMAENSTDFVNRMTSFLPDAQQQQQPPVVEEDTQPPKDLVETRAEFDKTRPWSDGMEAPRLDAYGNPYEDSIDHGNDLNAHYQKKFLKSLDTEAMLGAKEIGELGRYHVKRFAGAVPQLGDPKETFNYYKDQIG